MQNVIPLKTFRNENTQKEKGREKNYGEKSPRHFRYRLIYLPLFHYFFLIHNYIRNVELC